VALYIIAMTVFILVTLIFILHTPVQKTDFIPQVRKDSLPLDQFLVEDAQPIIRAPAASSSPRAVDHFYTYYDRVDDAMDRKISGTSKSS